MNRLFFALLFLSALAWAGSPWDNSNFQNQTFKTSAKLAQLAGDQKGLVITNSSFYAETASISTSPATNVFPPTMKNVTFLHCNLDNCIIPAGNTVGKECCNRMICANKTVTKSNDTDDWAMELDTKTASWQPKVSLKTGATYPMTLDAGGQKVQLK